MGAEQEHLLWTLSLHWLCYVATALYQTGREEDVHVDPHAHHPMKFISLKPKQTHRHQEYIQGQTLWRVG